jgi:hypothetical protein
MTVRDLDGLMIAVTRLRRRTKTLRSEATPAGAEPEMPARTRRTQWLAARSLAVLLLASPASLIRAECSGVFCAGVYVDQIYTNANANGIWI